MPEAACGGVVFLCASENTLNYGASQLKGVLSELRTIQREERGDRKEAGDLQVVIHFVHCFPDGKGLSKVKIIY